MIELITDKLVEIFGEDINIYRDNQKAGFKQPAFFIPTATIKSKAALNFMYKNVVTYQIVYIPRDDNQTDEMENVEMNLTAFFHDLGDYTVHNREFTISDNALVFMFDINSFVNPNKDGIKMESIQNEVNGKDV